MQEVIVDYWLCFPDMIAFGDGKIRREKLTVINYSQLERGYNRKYLKNY